jgi:hypothetical protein
MIREGKGNHMRMPWRDFPVTHAPAIAN